MAEDARQHLKTLGLQPGASAADIKQAYRELAAVWHPDRFANAPQLRDMAQAKMAEINAAYHFLKDNGAQGSSSPAYTPSTARPPTQNRWRTDYSAPGASRSNSTPPDAPPLQILHVLPSLSDQPFTDVGVTPDGKRILAVSGAFACLWDTGLASPEMHRVEKGTVDRLAVSSNGRYAAFANNLTGWMGGQRCEVRVWDLQARQERQRLKQAGHVTSLDFSPDGKQLAAGDFYGNVHFWEADTGRQVQTFPGLAENGSVRRVAYVNGSQAAKHVVTLRTGKVLSEITLWEVRRARRLKEFTLHVRECLTYGQISDILPSPDGRLLLVANNDPGNRNFSLHLWDMQTGEAVRAFRGHGDNVTCLAFGDGGRQIASGSEDKTVRVWDAQTGKEVGRGSGHTRTVRALAFTSDSDRLVSGGDDKTLCVWKLR